jgi:hypothetical protein
LEEARKIGEEKAELEKELKEAPRTFGSKFA